MVTNKVRVIVRVVIVDSASTGFLEVDAYWVVRVLLVSIWSGRSWRKICVQLVGSMVEAEIALIDG